ncbi:ornithine cyclodeaminase family protein [Phenylobacterium sp.]|uniref:ornithine cyclodeaminase family protein n=1 Tax=Phenylobacterium sp. TaxID=1871053 RepID=UPI002FCA229D
MKPLLTVSESVAKRLVTLKDAIALMETAFVSLDRGESLLFPMVSGHGSDPGTRFGAKAGFDSTRCRPGLKVGSYWPGNAARGFGNHGSTVLLLDDATGLPQALVAATHLTALRTAASDAVAVKHLARADASVLVLVGPGHQAYWDALAIAEVRALSEVLVCGRDPDAAEALAARLRQAGLPAAASAIGPALARADLVSTVTASREALFAAGDVRPGTHISAMGADGPGKRELAPALTATAALWADHPPQSLVLGEFQHVSGAAAEAIQPIGGLVAGRLSGRGSRDEITIYDSSGIALQDLAICGFALEQAQAQGLARPIDLS